MREKWRFKISTSTNSRGSIEDSDSACRAVRRETSQADSRFAKAVGFHSFRNAAAPLSSIGFPFLSAALAAVGEAVRILRLYGVSFIWAALALAVGVDRGSISILLLLLLLLFLLLLLLLLFGLSQLDVFEVEVMSTSPLSDSLFSDFFASI